MRTQRGFTLLELSVVITIIAIVTGMAAYSGVSVVATARITSTQKKMKVIDDTLMQYRVVNDRLPCPANLTIAPGSANYGVEGATPGTCTGGTPAANYYSAAGATNTGSTGVEGAVPTVTLGLPNDFMLDGWGNRIRYAVDVSMTANGAFASSSLACPPAGAITVKDGNGTARSQGSIYALISHGSNGHGAYTQKGVTYNAGSTSADELTNCHCTSAGVYNGSYVPTYVQKSPGYDAGQTGNLTYYFDDLVTYKERWQLAVSWDKASACRFIYVADIANYRVEKFSLKGQYISQFGTQGSGNGQFGWMGGLAVDSSGNVWVIDAGNGAQRVEEFDSNGNYKSKLTLASNSCARGLTIDNSNNFWVGDTCNFKVYKYNSSGTLLLSLGSGTQGGANNQFNYPAFIAIDANGNAWVTDSSGRVQEFNSSGAYLNTFGNTGSGCGDQLNGSSGIAIDANKNIWIASVGCGYIFEFSSSGAEASPHMKPSSSRETS